MARPFRYTFILAMAAACTTLAAVGGWRYARASAPVSGPVVLISVDSLRADHLPAYGYRKLPTPAIDALSEDGVVFEKAYSHAPLTLPAHASMLSGRLPFETGVRGTSGFSVAGSERMLAEVLADRGYATGAVVSSFALRKDTGIGQGFAFFDDGQPAADGAAADEPLLRDGTESELVAERWLESIGTPRAFLFLHIAEPHKPYAPPERFSAYAPYDGEIAYSDEIIGRFVRYLKRHQLYDQSTIILVSDHGEGLGDHGEQEHGLYVYAEVVRVPLIIKPAAGQGAGRRVTDLVQLIDLAPTILDLAKAPLPGSLRGASLKPLLDGTGRLQPRRAYAESLFGRYQFGWAGYTSITDGRHRLIRSSSGEELYEVEHDGAERNDIAAESADVRTALSAALDQMLQDTRIPEPAAVSPENRRRFEALGDVGAVSRPPDVVDGPEGLAVVEAYRAAVDRDAAREWPAAIDILQRLLVDTPASADVLARLGLVADRAGRYELAAGAYLRVAALRADDADAHLGAASALWRLRRFDQAARHAEIAASLAGDDQTRLRGSAHELLARIGIGRRDAAAAREAAALAQEAEKGRPVPDFVEGRLLQEQRRWEAALESFEQALSGLERSKTRGIADLHFYIGETLVRLERAGEAEYHFLEEIRQFPLNVRARSELAALYNAADRTDEANAAIAEMVSRAPTPEAFALASRMSLAFGNARQAASYRAEAQRRSATSQPATH